METTTHPEDTMTKQSLVAQAEKLETEADNLYMALLARSMRETTLREEARELRMKAESLKA
jgi:hypothetical protein